MNSLNVLARASGLVLSIVLFTACGADSLPTTGTLSLADFSVVEGEETLTITDDAISGTGTVIYPEPLTDEAFNHELTFTLDEGGTLAWVTFAEAELANGVEVKFSRTGASLGLSLLLDNGSATAESTLASQNAGETLNFSIDSHNDESPMHVLVFPGELTSGFTEANAVFNSEEDGAAPGIGAGKFFGVRLENASLTRVSGAAAKFAD